ncbi:Translin, C-terminal [Phytophthora cactorum]|nr:Translin, C-terminal [Phytophthora cactorum]
MHEYDEMREKIIKRSREILKARYSTAYKSATYTRNATRRKHPLFYSLYASNTCNDDATHSKQAIFALHRSDKAEALKLLGNAEKVAPIVIPELVALAEKNPSLRDGALSSSLEEYAEAKCFCYYLDTKCLLPRREVPIVLKNEYLGGVIDFTGELMRYAVVKATSREVDEVKRCKDMVEAISGELIQFDFRNGPLRHKFDSVKYNLRKLEVRF